MLFLIAIINLKVQTRKVGTIFIEPTLTSWYKNICPFLGSSFTCKLALADGVADVSKAKDLLGYAPQYKVGEGLKEAMAWYVDFISQQAAQ